MNWITLAVLGGVAAWFEYSYQRSRRKKNSSALPAPGTSTVKAVTTPSLPPGAENDQSADSAV